MPKLTNKCKKVENSPNSDQLHDEEQISKMYQKNMQNQLFQYLLSDPQADKNCSLQFFSTNHFQNSNLFHQEEIIALEDLFPGNSHNQQQLNDQEQPKQVRKKIKQKTKQISSSDSEFKMLESDEEIDSSIPTPRKKTKNGLKNILSNLKQIIYSYLINEAKLNELPEVFNKKYMKRKDFVALFRNKQWSHHFSRMFNTHYIRREIMLSRAVKQVKLQYLAETRNLRKLFEFTDENQS